MKCAISVPDEIFAAVEAQAARLGVSRSEFFAVAAQRYLGALAMDEHVAAVNELLDAIGIAGPDDETAWVVDAGRRSLTTVPWDLDV